MSRRGIQEAFWLHAAKKVAFDERNASKPNQNTREIQVQKQDLAATPPDSKEQLHMNTGPTTNSANTNLPHTQKQSTTSTVQGKSPKRQRTQLTGEGEPSNFLPPESPCFVNSADVGRTWHYTRRNDRRHRNRSIPFRVVSYNILADALLKSHPMLYEECSSWCLEWEYRKKNLLREILHYNADILCLQEVEEQHYENWFKPELGKAGYQGIYKKRTGAKVDGCATFYRESKFRLLTHCFYDYKKENVSVMDRDNVAVLTLLYPRYRDGGTCYSTAICVVNTHLLFNKNRGDIKLLQLACLFAEIDKLKKEFLPDKGVHKPHNSIKKIPVLLCGDFNTTPFCPLYNFVVQGFLNYKGMNKKALSGQNSPHRSTHGERDVIRGNIVPLELGLSMLSVWDEELTQIPESHTSASSSQTSSIFANDDFGSLNSDWQEYNSTPSVPSLPQQGSSGTVHPHRQEHNCNFDVRQSVPSSFSFMPQQGGARATPPLLPHYPQNTSSGHREFSSGLGWAGKDSSRYRVPQEPSRPKHNPSCTTIRHKLHFYSVYRHCLPNNMLEITTYHDKEPSCTVDYFFVAPGRDFLCGSCRQRHAVMELTSSLNLLTEEQVSLLGGLPNQKLSSDHLALVAGFILHV